MSDIDLQHLSVPEFKRLCGISRNTFTEMVEVLCPHLERQGQRGGQNKLSVEDQLLVTLEYWREYRVQQLLSGGRLRKSLHPPVSHRDQLGIARDDGGADCQKSRRPTAQVR